MGASTIEWTDYTLNPWRGCTKATWEDPQGKTRLHPGCLNCYAEKDMSVKLHGIRWGKGQERVPKAESGWSEPLRWARAAAKAGERRKVFCASLADVLDSEVPDSMRERLWPVIEETAWVCGGCDRPCAHSSDSPHRVARLLDLSSVGATCEGTAGRCTTTPMGGLDWLLLTKRPENWQKVPAHIRPLVWLGTSVSDQQTADEWVPRLLAAECFRYRFLSVEPLVGPVDLTRFFWMSGSSTAGPFTDGIGRRRGGGGIGGQTLTSLRTRDISWVIVGGESGRKARPCNVDWVRSIVRQCREAGVPCFVKQLGRVPIFDDPATDDTVFLKDAKGGNPAEWPEDLRVQQFPEAA